jgi:predicted CXXCH cytochrome family protein
VTKHKLSCRVCHGRDFPIVGEGAATSSTLSAQVSAQVAASGSKLTKSTSAGTNLLTTASTDLAGIDAAIQAGNTSCDACHAAMPHGTRSDCETCHGKIPLTTNGSEPTATAPAQSTYTQWSASGSNASVATPHRGYLTTTVKCAVCHSVHGSPSGGQLLLRGTANAACEYCHISTSLGGIVLYGGDVNAYYAIHDDASHDRTRYSSCANCHSVHGAKTIGGAKASKILWDWTASGRSSYATAALAVWPDPGTLSNGDAQVTAFCTGCHAYFTQSYDETLTLQSFDHENTYDWTWSTAKSHVMTDTVGGQADPASSLATGTPVAWASSAYCRSCHDAGATDQGVGIHSDSFPHYTQGYFQFMTIGPSFDTSRSSNLTPDVDGLCLKCHRNNTQGVGLTY